MRDRLLYVLYEFVFWAFLLVSAPYYLIRMAREPRVRASIPSRFGFGPRWERGRPGLWVHGVSVGEVKTARPLLAALRARYDMAISSTTPAGMEFARASYPLDFVFQFPLDLSLAIGRVFRRIRPRAILLMELEVWPNLLRHAARSGVPVIVVNGRISERSFRGYRRFGRLMPRFEMISLYSVQTEAYAERLRALGVPESQIRVSGNLKYDALLLDLEQSAIGAVRKECREELALKQEDRLLVAGSTHGGEEELLLDLYARLLEHFPDLRMVLVPRHVERGGEVERLVERRGFGAIRLTRLRASRTVPSGSAGAEPPAVVIADTIGELEKFYGMADLVFVGGSLVPIGGHNILEPAGLGKAVLFGPHMDNFEEEARLLRAHRAAAPVADLEELIREAKRLLASPEEAEALGRRALEAVRSVRGTTQKTLDLILTHLGDDPPGPAN